MERDRQIAFERGARIARQRKKMRMRSADVAALMAVTPLTFSRWEKSFPQSALDLHGQGLANVLIMSFDELANGTAEEATLRTADLASPRVVLANRARNRRLDLQLSLGAVCASMGVSLATLRDWEIRLPRSPRVRAEAIWESELSVPPGWLRNEGLEATPVRFSAAQSNAHVIEAIDVGLSNASSEILAVAYWLSRRAITRRTCDRAQLNATELRGADMFARRYGICGSEQSVLQAIGDHYTLSRERVRQILDRMLERAIDLPIETHAFKELKRVATQSPTLSVQGFEEQYRELLGPTLSLEDADRFAREVLGFQIATITRLNRPNMAGAPVDMVGSTSAMDLVLAVRECAFRLIRAAGAAHIMFVAGMVSERMVKPVCISEVRHALPVMDGFEWLTDDEDWFWLGSEGGYNRPLDCVRKILAVAAARVDVEDLHQGICRCRRLVYGEDRNQPPALEMPIWVLKAMLHKVAWLKTIQHDDFVLTEAPSLSEVLSPSELSVVDFITSCGGVSSRQMLNKEFVSCGKFSAPALALVLTASPVLQSLGDGMFSIRGRSYSVDSLESARRQFGAKPREMPTVDDAGRLEFSLRLTPFQLQNATLDFPSHIVRLLPPGQYAVTGLCEGPIFIGQVPSAPARVTRLASLLKNSGVLAYDHLVLTVDPDLKRISVRIDHA